MDTTLAGGARGALEGVALALPGHPACPQESAGHVATKVGLTAANRVRVIAADVFSSLAVTRRPLA